MKSKLMKIGMILFPFVLILGIWYVRGRAFTELGYRLYPFSRVVCDVQLTVDGQPCPVSESMVTPDIFSSGAENTIRSVKQTDDGGRIKCRGLEYGGQPFFIHVTAADGRTIAFKINPVCANYWEITNIHLVLDVDSESNTYSASYKYTMYHEELFGSKENEEMYDENTITMSGI